MCIRDRAYLSVRLAEWLNRGVISRFGLIVRHRPLGYAANAMCVWDVPDARADAAGAALAREEAVTPVSYTHLRAHETPEHLVCRLLLE